MQLKPGYIPFGRFTFEYSYFYEDRVTGLVLDYSVGYVTIGVVIFNHAFTLDIKIKEYLKCL